jgi:hypothetical protein
MTEDKMTPLRQRMMEDMRIHHQGGRQHDGTPVTPPRRHPESLLVPGRYRFALCPHEHAQMAPNDGKIYRSVSENNTTTRSHLVNAPLAEGSKRLGANHTIGFKTVAHLKYLNVRLQIFIIHPAWSFGCFQRRQYLAAVQSTFACQPLPQVADGRFGHPRFQNHVIRNGGAQCFGIVLGPRPTACTAHS